jgi:hypothetical protein
MDTAHYSNSRERERDDFTSGDGKYSLENSMHAFYYYNSSCSD